MSNSKITAKAILRFLKDVLIVLSLGLFVSFLLIWDITAFIDSIHYIAYYSVSIGVLFWKGNDAINDYLEKIIPWKKAAGKRLFVNVTTSIAYMFIVLLVVNIVLIIFIQGESFSTFVEQLYPSLFSPLFVTVIIIWIFYSAHFFSKWKEGMVREEQFKHQMLTLEYEALKNQVNPHFLFNNLNTLTAIVSDNDDAVKFIKKLSDVYRYLLEHKNKEVVALSVELDFIKSYIYLNKIRFGDNLLVEYKDININGMIIPLSMQIIVENAIKHNVISEEEPLHIDIFSENGYLVVKNDLNLKKNVVNSNKIGLQNIKSRYEYLTETPFLTTKTEKSYIAKIPVLQQNEFNN